MDGVSTFCLPQSTLPLSKAVNCIAVAPSNSLFVAVTDYRILLFCFDFTRHSYYGSLRGRKVGGRGIYTYGSYKYQVCSPAIMVISMGGSPGVLSEELVT